MEKSTIQELLQFIQSKSEYLDIQYRMFDVYNGNLTPYLKQRIRDDFKSDQSYSEAISRLSVINILPKIVNKVSKVYNQTYVSVKNERYQDEVDTFLWDTKFDEVRIQANKALNLSGCCALEPVYNDDYKFVRVLQAHQFLVYSMDDIDPNRITHFIKILKKGFNSCSYAIYTKDEYVEIDSSGKILHEEVNEYGVIPFVYIRRCSELMPSTPTDDWEMITLLPLLLTDANYALKYQAFSIIYTMNLDSKNLDLAPNTIWNLSSNGADGDKPEIGHIKPSLSIDEVLKNLSTQYTLWLETKNLKSQNITQGFGATVDSASGVSKLIDEADINDDLDTQRKILLRGEEALFELLAIKTGVSGFDETTITMIAESRVPELQSDKISRIIMKRDAGLITKVDAVREANSFNTQQEAEDYLKLIEAQEVVESESV